MYKENKTEELTLEDLYAPNWQIFAFLAVLNILISFWAHRLIFTKEIYYSLLSDQMEILRIDEFIEVLDRFSLMSLLVVPLVMLIKMTINSLVIQIPLLLQDIEIRFKKMFRIILLSSIVLSVGQLVHYIWIYLTPVKYISYRLIAVNPFSLATIFPNGNFSPGSVYILGQFNVFEILWCFCIYLGLLGTNKIKKQDAAMLVFTVWALLLFLQYVIYYFIGKIQ